MPFALLAVIGAHPSPAGILIGAALLMTGEWLRLAAASAIGPHSRGTSRRAPQLVTTGPYAGMRHPLYAGNGVVCAGLLVFSGAFFPWLPLLFVPAFLFQYGLFIRLEEQYLAAQWGSAWADYCRQVPRFGLPFGRWTITSAGWKLEWPTIRTVIALVSLMIAAGLIRRHA